MPGPIADVYFLEHCEIGSGASGSSQHRRPGQVCVRAIGSWLAPIRTASEMSREEASMNGDYVFLCGVMWCAYGQQDAASELLRAVNSADPDLSALASAMLAQREETRHPLAESTI
jgi:hypothetical protein